MRSAQIRAGAYLTLLAACLAPGCGERESAKIRLAATAAPGAADVQVADSVLRVAPSAQRTIAIDPFRNETGDSELDWLRRGLSDALVRELAGGRGLIVLGPGGHEELRRAATAGAVDAVVEPEMAAASLLAAARAAGVDSLVGGRYYHEGSDLVIDAEIRHLDDGRRIQISQVRASGLEGVLAAVGELSLEVHAGLSNADGRLEPPLPPTSSVVAYRHFTSGRANLERLLLVAAEGDFELAIAADPSFAAAYLNSAQIRLTLGDFEAARGLLDQARAHPERLRESELILLQLREAELAFDVERVRALREELLAKAPNDLDVRMDVACLYFKYRESDRALAEFEQIIALDPSRKLALNYLGYLYAHRGDFPTAYRYLHRYRDLSPGEPNAHDSIGEVLMMEGRFEQAVEHFERALERWPDFYNSAMRLTEAYAELGEVPRALEYAQRWSRIAPNDKVRELALLRRVGLLWRYGRLDDAETALAEVTQLNPSSLKGAWFAAGLRRSRGDAAGGDALWHAFFAAHVPATARTGWDDSQNAWLLNLGLRAGENPSTLAELSEAMTLKNPAGPVADLLVLYRGVARLRAGESFEGSSGGGLRDSGGLASLIAARQFERATMWRYVVQAIELEPEQPGGASPIADKVRAAAAKAERKDLEVMARLLELQYDSKYRRTAELTAGYRELGMPPVAAWRVTGPYPNRAGLVRAFPPEPGFRASPASAPSASLAWRPADDGVHDGFVDLRAVIGEAPWGVGYAAVRVQSPDERVVQLRLGSDESCKLWVNDEPVWQAYRMEEAALDTDIVQVILRRGDNRILLKVTNGIGDWGFYMRFTDLDGVGMPDLRFAAPGGELATTAPPPPAPGT